MALRFSKYDETEIKISDKLFMKLLNPFQISNFYSQDIESYGYGKVLFLSSFFTEKLFGASAKNVMKNYLC